MITVYERMVKLFPDGSQGEQYNLIFGAILNLKSEIEIKEFVQDYKKFRPNWRYEIAYALGFYSKEDRELWHNAVGDIIGINILLNRSERELYTQFEFVDDKGNSLPEYNDYVNPEKGNHQSK